MGAIGSQLAKQLSAEHHDIVVIDPDPSKLEYVDSISDVLTVEGSATQIHILKEARIDNADLVIAVTSKEEVNISTAIIAKQLGAKKTLARVANDEYISPDCSVNFNALGIDHMIYPEDLAAFETVKLMKRSAATDVIEYENGKLSLLGFRLDATAPVIRKSILEVASEYASFDFRIVAIQRGQTTIIPSAKDLFLKNDQVFIITTPAGIDMVLDLAGKKDQKFEDLMILGGGRIGRKTAQMLEDELNIKLLESNKEKSYKLADQLAKTLVIHGDGRDIDLLAQEGIIDMDAFIAVTNDAETNIISCLMAKHLGVKKVIALVDNVDYIPLAQTIGLDSLINKKLIAANNITRTIRKGSIVSSSTLYGVDAEIFEMQCQEHAPITKAPLKSVRFPKDAILGGILRNGEGMIAVGDTEIQPGDKAVVFSLPGTIDKVKKLFG